MYFSAYTLIFKFFFINLCPNLEIMRLKGNFEIQEQGGKLFLVKRKEDTGKLVRLGLASESMAWLFEQLKGKEFEVQDISSLLQRQYRLRRLMPRLSCLL